MRRFLLAAVLLVCALGAVAEAPFTPTQYRLDTARTGATTAEPIRAQPVVAWTRAVDGVPDALLHVGGGLLAPFQTGRNTGALSLLDADTGDPLWTVDLSASPMGTPAFDGERAIIGTSDGALTAYGVADGGMAWQARETGRVWGGPLLLDGRVIVSADNGVFAFDAATGERAWRKVVLGANVSPVFAGGDLIANDGSTLFGLDPATGDERWRLARPGAIWLWAAALDGMAVAAGTEVIAFDLTTRDVLWAADMGEQGLSAPLLLPDLVVVGGMDGRMRAFDRMTGELRWQVVADDWTTADAVAAGDVIYFGTGNHMDETPAPRPLYAVDAATGETLWIHMADGYIYFGAAVADGLLWYADTAGNVVALTDREAEADRQAP